MTGFDSVTSKVRSFLFGMAWFPLPTYALLDAKTSDKLATFKNAFADFRMPALAVA